MKNKIHNVKNYDSNKYGLEQDGGENNSGNVYIACNRVTKN